MIPRYRIGTRKSALARIQSEQVRQALRPLGVDCELVEILSSGDRDRKTPLYELQSSEPGHFTKQLETALLEKHVDLAVHSLKDLPTLQPTELAVAAIPARVAAEDCLIASSSLEAPKGSIIPLPHSARVGTSSLRREAQMLSVRPDLRLIPLRGNVPTRLKAVRDGRVDAVVLAEAGLFRLHADLSGLKKTLLTDPRFVGAPGQGALAVEVRKDSPPELLRAVRALNDTNSEKETRIERKVLRRLEGGCTLPLGVRCFAESSGLKLFAFLGIARDRGEGKRHWESFHSFDIFDPEEESLVAKTVQHFREILARRPAY